MEKKFDAIIDLKGNAVKGATVQVNTYPAGALATIYSDSAGLSPIPNPMVTDDTSYFEYYAANGHYSWVITTNEGVKTINEILHADP